MIYEKTDSLERFVGIILYAPYAKEKPGYQVRFKGDNMDYRSIDTSMLELHNADVLDVVTATINSKSRNRAERRKNMKALGKMENRERYFADKQLKTSNNLRKEYQKELDSRVASCKEQLTDGLVDNWKKSIAVVALVLKRKYNWSNGRIWALVEKIDTMHIEMLESGEWDNIEEILDEECDIQLEVTD